MRTVLHFHPAIAPVKIGILPLSKKLNEGAEKVFAELSKTYNCDLMTEAILVRDIEDRMKLVHHSVLLMTLILRKTELLQYVTETQWNRKELRLRI